MRDKLIQKMLYTWFNYDHFDMSTMSTMSTLEGQTGRMNGVLDEVLAEVLPDPTECDYEKQLDAVIATWNWDRVNRSLGHYEVKQMLRDAICIFWTNCRAKYAPTPKPPEDRVTVVEWMHSTGPKDKWIVLLDGWNMSGSATFADKHKADTYRLGWIAQLKEQINDR